MIIDKTFKGGIFAKGNVRLIYDKNAFNINIDERIISNIWNEEKKRLGDGLFDGQLFCGGKIEYDDSNILIYGSFLPYRYIVARMRKGIFKEDILPLGVSGITITNENGKKFVVFAKRAANSFLDAGLIELVPSGGIDRECLNDDGTFDIEKMLIKEFDEETGINSSEINKISGWTIIYDESWGTLELCAEININCKIQEVIDSISKSKEYSSPVCIDYRNLAQFLNENKHRMVRTSYYLASEIKL